MDVFCNFVLREEIDLDKSNPKLSRDREREREHTTKGFWHVSRLDKLMNIIGLLGSYHQKWFAITFTGKSSKFYSAFTQSGAPMFCFPQKHRISLRFLNWKFKGQHVKGQNVRTSFNAFCKTLESGQALLFCIGPLHIFFGERKALWTIFLSHQKPKAFEYVPQNDAPKNICLFRNCLWFFLGFWETLLNPLWRLATGAKQRNSYKKNPDRSLPWILKFGWLIFVTFVKSLVRKWKNMKILQVFSKQTEFHRAWKRIFYRTFFLQVLFWSSRGLLDNDEPH